MADEFFDVVDGENRFLGMTKSRAQVHKDGDWHRVVHIYITNGKGEYLVHLRSPYKDLHPTKWDTRFGGHVVAGSDYDATAVLELQQEIGLNVKIADLTPGEVHKYDGTTNREFIKLYFYTFNGDIATLKFNDGEVSEIKWMLPEDIIKSAQAHPDQWVSSADKILELTKR